MTESRARKRARLGVLLLAGLFWLGTSQSVFAFGWVPTQKEYFLLPDYCKAKMSEAMRGFLAGKIGSTSVWRREAASMLMPEPEIKLWRERVGGDFQHVHHYCYGLALMGLAEDREALRRSGGSARWSYGQAVGEIDYTRSLSRPGAPLWEAMSISYARALSGAGRWPEAQTIFQDLLVDSPSNSDVWVEYARQLKRRGKLNDAIALLEQGLEKASKQGSLLYWLAQYQYEVGDLTRAAETAARAEAAGMKMRSLNRKLGREGS